MSERYKRQEHIEARGAQYFFVLSFLCAVLTLPLLLFSHLASIPLSTIGAMILFSICLAGMPYYIYYYLLSHHEIDFVLRYSFLIIFATVGGQAILVGHVTPAILLASTLVIFGAVLPLFKAGGRRTHA